MRIADDSIALVGQGSRGTGHGRRSMDSSGASFAQVLEGAREALIYMKDSTAMVVSVTNRTVITALDDVTAADSIFTNIDSAAII